MVDYYYYYYYGIDKAADPLGAIPAVITLEWGRCLSEATLFTAQLSNKSRAIAGRTARCRCKFR